MMFNGGDLEGMGQRPVELGDLALEALGELEIGVFVCTSQIARFLLANETARRQLRDLGTTRIHPSLKAAIASSMERESLAGTFTFAVPLELPSGRRLFVRTKPLVNHRLLVTLSGEVLRERELLELLHERFELSVRERQLIALLRAGQSNERIAADLGISVGTVKQYLNRIFKTFDVHSRGELVALIERVAREESPK